MIAYFHEIDICIENWYLWLMQKLSRSINRFIFWTHLYLIICAVLGTLHDEQLLTYNEVIYEQIHQDGSKLQRKNISGNLYNLYLQYTVYKSHTLDCKQGKAEQINIVSISILLKVFVGGNGNVNYDRWMTR